MPIIPEPPSATNLNGSGRIAGRVVGRDEGGSCPILPPQEAPRSDATMYTVQLLRVESDALVSIVLFTDMQ